MTPEKQTTDAKAQQKQKIIIGVIIVVIIFVAWQVLGMGGGGGTAPATPTPVASAPARPPAGATNSMQAPAAPAGMAVAPAAGATPEMTVPKQEKISMNNQLSKLQQSQSDYIASLNKLQMLKLQREIDETEMAIATAELNKMTAEKNIANLIISKEQQEAGPSEPSPANPTVIVPAPAPAKAAAPPPPPPPEAYNVLAVSYEGKKWSAVITSSGEPSQPSPGRPSPGIGGSSKMYTVGVGDTLPPDGSMVVGIDKQGVTLKRNGTTRFIALAITSM